MALTLTLSPEAEGRLAAKAQAAGVDVTLYVTRLVEQAAKSPASLSEISGPIAEHVAASGVSEDDLAAFLEAEKHAMRDERRAR